MRIYVVRFGLSIDSAFIPLYCHHKDIKNTRSKDIKMPRKCCVLTCPSNKKTGGPYITVFTFPKDEERKAAWLRKINRNNFNPSKNSAVCIKHFEEKFIEREFRDTRPDESFFVVPRTKLALTSNAYPSIFEFPTISKREKSPRKRKSQDSQTSNMKLKLPEELTTPYNQTFSEIINLSEELTPPKDISSKKGNLAANKVISGKKTSSRKVLSPSRRNAPGWQKKQQACEEEAYQVEINQFADVKACKEWCHTFSVENFASFKEQVEGKLPEGWIVIRKTANDIYLGKHDFSGVPKLLVAVKIDSDLKVDVWQDGILLDDSNLSWLLGQDMRCELWTTFDCLLSYLHSCNTV